jgi:adenylate cyclase
VAALGFDVLFSEADTSSGLACRRWRGGRCRGGAFRAQLERLSPSLNYDHRFAEACGGRPVVLGYYFPATAMAAARVCCRRRCWHLAPGRTRARGAGVGWLRRQPARTGAGRCARGFFNSVTDDDGVVRSLPVLSRHAGQYYESLALALYRVAQGRAVAGLTWAGMPGAGGGRCWRPCCCKAPAVSRRSAWRWIRPARRWCRSGAVAGPEGLVPLCVGGRCAGGPRPGRELRGRIVLVGSTSPGLLDLRATPVGQIYPGWSRTPT